MGREALAEGMIPVIGRLYRENNVVTTIHGRSLVNKSTMDILKAHRFARLISEDELLLEETAPLLEALARLELAPAAIDIARLTVKYHARATGQRWRSSSAPSWPTWLASAAATTAPAPTSCSTASAASAACWPAS